MSALTGEWKMHPFKGFGNSLIVTIFIHIFVAMWAGGAGSVIYDGAPEMWVFAGWVVLISFLASIRSFHRCIQNPSEDMTYLFTGFVAGMTSTFAVGLYYLQLTESAPPSDPLLLAGGVGLVSVGSGALVNLLRANAEKRRLAARRLNQPHAGPR
jgi:hypothetical protein